MTGPDADAVLTTRLAWVTLDHDGNTVVRPLSELSADERRDMIYPDELTAEQRATITAFLAAKIAAGEELTDAERYFVRKYTIELPADA